jgi:hypothetical protein
LSVPYDSRGTGHNWIRVMSADGPVSVRVEHGSGALVTAATSHFCSFGVFVPVGSTFQLIIENDAEFEIKIEYNVHSVCGPGDLDRYYAPRGGGCVGFALALAMVVVAFFTQISLALNP